MSVKRAFAVAVQANEKVLLWGPPGVGKSSFVAALGRALDVPVEVVIASIREPSDFAGLPVVRDDGTFLVPPSWARRLAEAGRGLLFLDEISTAPPAVQAALLRVVLDRVVGDLELPPGVAVVAAANPPEQAAGGWDLTPPLANRFCHLTWELDAGEWTDGMLRGWPTPSVPYLPTEWKAGVGAQAALVAAFVRARPHLLLQVPKNEAEAGRAWPSPRTWEMAARLMAAAQAAGVGEEVEAALVSGCVGSGPALEFISWRRNLDLPDPEELLADPSRFVLPDRGDRQYAVLASVVAAAIRHLTPDRWMAAWEILAKAGESVADVAAVAARSLAAARRADLPTPVQQLKPFLPILQAAKLIPA